MFSGRMTFFAALLAACEMATAGSQEAARLEHNLQPKTLTPIELKTSPAGYVMKFVDEGELRFAIVRDARYDKAEHWTSGDSVKPAVDLLVEAFEKTTGKRPAVLDAEKDSEKIAKCPYLLLVGNSRYVEEQGFDWKTLPIEGAQWNWNWDYEAALDEQWMLLYGPKAGPAMKEFHRLLKKAYFDYCNEVSDASPGFVQG